MLNDFVSTSFESARSRILDYKNLQCTESDIVRYKEMIKNALISDDRILYLINNEAIEKQMNENEDIDGELFVGRNILPYYLIPNVETTRQTYICYDYSFSRLPKYQSIEKYGHINFYILCEINKNDVFGMCRHDLIGQVIIDIFNWSHIFDTQLHLVSNEASVVDSNYATRTLIFEHTSTNSIVQTNRIGVDLETKVINKYKGL